MTTAKQCMIRKSWAMLLFEVGVVTSIFTSSSFWTAMDAVFKTNQTSADGVGANSFQVNVVVSESSRLIIVNFIAKIQFVCMLIFSRQRTEAAQCSTH